MKLYHDLLCRVPIRAVGGEEYCYECYGKNARYLDLESNITIIFDEKTELIYEITILGEDAEPELIWRDPNHKDSFFTELKKRRAIH